MLTAFWLLKNPSSWVIYLCMYLVYNEQAFELVEQDDRAVSMRSFQPSSKLAPSLSPLRFGRQTCAVLISQVSLAWKDSGSLPPSTIMLPVDSKDCWYSFYAMLCAWKKEKEENDDKPSGPPLLRNSRSPEETTNKKKTTHKKYRASQYLQER